MKIILYTVFQFIGICVLQAQFHIDTLTQDKIIQQSKMGLNPGGLINTWEGNIYHIEDAIKDYIHLPSFSSIAYKAFSQTEGQKSDPFDQPLYDDTALIRKMIEIKTDDNTFASIQSSVCSPPGAFSLISPGAASCTSGATLNYQVANTCNWQSSSGAVGYDIQISQYPYGTAGGCGTPGNIVAFLNCTPGTSAIIPANTLVPGMLYRWNVNAFSECYNANCEKSSTNILYFQTPPEIGAYFGTCCSFVPSPVGICPGGSVSITSTYFLAVNAPGAITYQWYRDGNLVQSGPTDTYIATTGGTYTMKVTYSGSNCCSSAQTVASNEVVVIVNPLPGTASITGDNNPCQGFSKSYMANASNATSFTWTVPSGWTINSGQGTATINVTVGANSGQVCATPFNACGNGTTGCKSVSVVLLAGTASISGDGNPCQGFNKSYTANASNTTSYTWTVPSGWTINSGQGTAMINVTVGSTSGQICATPSNICGNGSTGCLPVTVIHLVGPATVSGDVSPCQGASKNYTANAGNATSYTWSVPPGWTINAGQGTSSINVTVGSTSGQICATPSNICGNGSTGCLSATVIQLAGPATVSGDGNPCQGFSKSYTANASNATSYSWTVPSGWIINSGQGTATINVTVGANAGQVCATPSNTCGSGATGCKPVSVILLVGPATVSGDGTPCQGANKNYTANASNANAYTWTVPSGWTINSGQGTPIINVTVGVNSGQVCATPSNVCGNGSTGCFSVAVIPLPGAASISGDGSPCQGFNKSYTANASNTTSYTWTVPSGWTINSGQGTATLNVTVGASSGQVCATPSNTCGNGTTGCKSVSVIPLVGTASISGDVNPCQGFNKVYTASASNATSYTWTVPSGWTINSGQGTATINVMVGSISGQICTTPANICGNGPMGCLSATVIPLAGPASISGPSSACLGSSQGYTASATNSTAYTWTVPAGWTINSGQGTATINVTVGSTSGQICATPSNNCGNGSTGCLSVTVVPLVGAASISGDVHPCLGSSQNYTANASNATSYAWTIPSGWTINSGQGTATINVTVGSTSGLVCATPSNVCGTGMAACQSVAVNTAPSAPTIVANGSTSLCNGQSVKLSVTNPCTGCTFLWSNGQTDTSITVTQAGNYFATAANICGTSAASNIISVTEGTPPSAPTIAANGSTSLCNGQSVVLSVNNPCSGCSFLWSNGLTGASITVSQVGNYFATAINACGTSGASNEIPVTMTQPVGAVSISGNVNPCQGSSITFMANASNATSYTWTVPSGWTINSGQGTATINVTVGSISGQLCATPSNVCGNGLTGCVSATVIQLVGMVSLSGDMNVCPGSNKNYSAIASNATSYTWTVPPGWTINSGQGTTTINVTVGSTSGQVCATPSNICGSGPTGCKSVTVDQLLGSASISGDVHPCLGSNQNYTSSAANATSYGWTVPSGWTINSGQGTATINVTIGSTSGLVCATPSNVCSTGTAGCQSVAVNTAPAVPAIVANGSTSLCNGQSVKLSVNNPCTGCTFLWSNGQTDTSITVTQAGNYAATATNACGTSGTSNLIPVTEGTPPSAPAIVAIGSTLLCNGQSVILSVNNPCSGCSFLWSNGLTGTSITVSQAGNYSATTTNACGTSGASNVIVVTMIQLPVQPVIVASGSTSLCNGQSVELSISNPCTGCSFLWSNGQSTPTITVTEVGSYYAVAANGCGMSNSSNMIEVKHLDFVPVFQVNLDPSNNVYHLAAPNGTGFQWYLNGQPIPGATMQFYTATATGYYTLQMTNNDGCTGLSEPVFIVTVGIDETPSYKSITAFPNPTDQTIFLNVILSKEANLSIDLYSVYGDVIQQGLPITMDGDVAKVDFDVSSIHAGLYYFLIRDFENKSVNSVKFLVVH